MADVHHVSIGGTESTGGIWIDRHGHLAEDSARLAGSTLIWERDGATYRVEGDLTRREAIAASLR